MRGYFAVGVDGISKSMNLGNLIRIAHAFEASFFFSVNARVKFSDTESDTSRASLSMPSYNYDTADEMRLPVGCSLVGVEITEDAVELPRFRHPHRAAYLFGAERNSISPQMLKRCEFVVRIPMRFSINVGMAGAIVLYDRLVSLGGYPGRPLMPNKPDSALIPPPHKWGAPRVRSKE
ncbi:MAG: RNA methyltransferase [Rhizomicrobium sp.]